MPRTEVDGVEVHYACRRPSRSDGPPVVFVHGAGGSHQHWLYQVRDLPGSLAYAPDLPGHGRSGGPGRVTVGAYADWLAAFLDAAGLERAVLVGHSMGGAIALDLALRSPSRVLGLGLVATGARLGVAPAILNGILEAPERAVDLITTLAFGPQAPPELADLGRAQMAATPPQILHGDFVACNDFNAKDRLGEVAVPCTVVCGTEDRLTPAKYSTYLRDRIPGASLHLVEDAGHMVMIEEPAALILTLTTLVARIQARASGTSDQSDRF